MFNINLHVPPLLLLLRLHDVCGRAAVCRVGSFLRHTSVSDHAGPHGAEQGQLGRPAAGTKLRLRGGGTQQNQHRRRRGRGPTRRRHRYDRRRNQLQRNTSGKQKILTLLVCPFTSASWPLTPVLRPHHTLGAERCIQRPTDQSLPHLILTPCLCFVAFASHLDKPLILFNLFNF